MAAHSSHAAFRSSPTRHLLLLLVLFVSMDARIEHMECLGFCYATHFGASATTVTEAGVPSVYPLDVHAWTPQQKIAMYNATSTAYAETRPMNLISMFDFETATQDGSNFFRDTAPLGISTAGSTRSTRRASLHGGVLVTPQGYSGGAVYFDGTSYLEIDDFDISPSSYPELTMGAWVKVSSTLADVAATGAFDKVRYLMTNENMDGVGGTDRGIGLDTRSGTSGWSAYNGMSAAKGSDSAGFLGSIPVIFETWVFVAAVYTATTVQLHVDDQMIESSCDMTGGGGFSSLRLGRGFDEIYKTSTTGFHGTVDNVFVYNAAITQDDIASLRSSVPALLPPSVGSAGYALEFFGAEDSSEAVSFAADYKQRKREGYAAAPTLAPPSFYKGVTGVTVAVWLSPTAGSLDDASQTATIVDKSGGDSTEGSDGGREYRLELYYETNMNTYDVRFSLGDQNGKSWSIVWNTHVSIPVAPVWTHVAVTWDALARDGDGWLALYVDGALSANRTAAGPTTKNYASELTPSNGDLLVGASRMDTAANQVVHGAQAPNLASSDKSTPSYHGPLMSFYHGLLDELQVWHAARSREELESVRTHRRRLRGDEEGLAGYWTMDEGYGSYSINDGDISRDSRYGALQLVGGERPTFVMSEARVGEVVETPEDVDAVVVLNATDVAGRSLLYVIDTLPANGDLYLVTEGGSGASGRRGVHVSVVPFVLPAGVASLLYAPSLDEHSSEIDDSGQATVAYASFKYSIKTMDATTTTTTATTTATTTSANVLIFVDPVDDLPQFVTPLTVALQFQDYGVDDPDAWEREGGDNVGITLSIHDTKSRESIVPGAATSSGTQNGIGSESSSDSTLSLGSTHALDFSTLGSIGDGTNDGAGTRFLGTLDNVNNALRDFTIVTPPVFGGTVSMQVDDRGDQGRGGALSEGHSLGVNLRSGSIPSLIDAQPLSAPPNGGEDVVLTGTNFHAGGNHVCLFGGGSESGSGGRATGVRTNATLISPVSLRCPIPPTIDGMTVGSTTLAVVNDAGFTSNSLQFLYELAPSLIKVEPMTGPSTGGTSMLVLGEGFSRDGNIACRFGSSKIVQATFVSPSVVRCITPPRREAVGRRLSAGGVDGVECALRVSNNGVHFSSTTRSFVYEKPISMLSVHPSSGPSLGRTPVTVRGLNFVNTTSLTCRFGSSSALATYVDATKVICFSPSSSNVFGRRQPLPLRVSVSISNNGRDYAITDGRNPEFTYVSPVTVQSLTPNSGPVEGGTIVLVRGTHLSSSDVLRCRFGTSSSTGIVVPGTYVSEKEVRCVAPPLPVGRVSVELTTNDVDYTSDAVQYEYKVQASVNAISPALGPRTGGTIVMVSGSGFPEAQDLRCRFGEGGPLTIATWIGETVLECATPASLSSLSAVAVALQVTSNMVDFTDTSEGAIFTYNAPVVVNSLSPPEGPQRGGTLLTIAGDGFVAATGCKCSFGDVTVHATVLNTTHLQCTTPSVTMTSSSSSQVNMEVSMNGLQFTSQQVEFSFYHSIQLSKIIPNTGPTIGGTQITVRGHGFLPTPRLACLFNSVSTTAVYVSSTMLTCTVPPATTLITGAAVTVTNNGVDVFHDGALQFTYHPLPSISSLAPTFGSINGGTVVLVRGAHFVRSAALMCRVGNTPAAVVQYLSSSALLCTIPPMSMTLYAFTYAGVVAAARLHHSSLTDMRVPMSIKNIFANLKLRVCR